MRYMSISSNAPGASATYYLDGTTLRYRTETVRGAAKDMAVCGSDEFIAMAFDRSIGGVLKHGPADRVRDWATAAKIAFRAAGCHDLADDIEVCVFLPTEPALAELNACIATTGRFPADDLRQPHTEVGDPPVGMVH